MGFESNFGKQRSALAQSLRDERNAGDTGRESARSHLEEARQSESYVLNKTLHTLEKELDGEVVGKNYEGIHHPEIPEGWKEESISELVPEKYKHLLDIAMLAKVNQAERGKKLKNSDSEVEKHNAIEDTLFRLRFGRTMEESYENEPRENIKAEIEAALAKETKESQDFWNTITDGRFLDPHNLNHFINAETGKNFEGPFDMKSSVQPGMNLWASAHGSLYAPLYETQLIILSPNNPIFREFLEKAAFANPYGMGENTPALLEAFLKGKELPRFSEEPSTQNWFGVGIHEEQRQKQEAGEGYTWMDIADCIVDLKEGKRWIREYSSDESREVKQDIEAYRTGVKTVK